MNKYGTMMYTDLEVASMLLERVDIFTKAAKEREDKLVAALMKVLLIAVSNDYSYIKKILTTTLTELGYND